MASTAPAERLGPIISNKANARHLKEDPWWTFGSIYDHREPNDQCKYKISQISKDDLCSRENSKIPETPISQYQSGHPGVGVFPFRALDLHKQESRRCDRHSVSRKYLRSSRQFNQHPDRCEFPGGSVRLLELPAHGLASPPASTTRSLANLSGTIVRLVHWTGEQPQ